MTDIHTAFATDKPVLAGAGLFPTIGSAVKIAVVPAGAAAIIAVIFAATQATTGGSTGMGKLAFFIFVLIVLAAGAGVVYLMTADVPPPSERTEKVLPDDMFPK